MRVTICQLPNDRDAFARAWSALVEHVQTASSELVVLPEMPFSTWLAAAKDVAQDRWNAAVRAHDEAIDTHLPALAPATVVASRPVVDAGVNLNRGFIWTRDGGVVDAHDKYYLPDEPGFYETDWYSRGDGTFAPRPAAGTTLGFQICSEMWFFERGRHYGQQGARVIVSPRATGASSVERWITGGRALAMSASGRATAARLSARLMSALLPMSCSATADDGVRVFDHQVTDLVQETTSEAFEIPKAKIISIETYAPVQNAWAAADIALVNDNQEVVMPERIRQPCNGRATCSSVERQRENRPLPPPNDRSRPIRMILPLRNACLEHEGDLRHSPTGS